MTMERPQEEIDWYFERFTELIQRHQTIRADLSTMKIQYQVRTQKGRVYWKIFVDTYELATGFDHDYPDGLIRTKIFGFVRRKDGAIFRAATYKAPETDENGDSRLCFRRRPEPILHGLRYHLRRRLLTFT